jgi:hypothetical protein
MREQIQVLISLRVCSLFFYSTVPEGSTFYLQGFPACDGKTQTFPDLNI